LRSVVSGELFRPHFEVAPGSEAPSRIDGQRPLAQRAARATGGSAAAPRLDVRRLHRRQAAILLRAVQLHRWLAGIRSLPAAGLVRLCEPQIVTAYAGGKSRVPRRRSVTLVVANETPTGHRRNSTI
jgi:hypothetical protein